LGKVVLLALPGSIFVLGEGSPRHAAAGAFGERAGCAVCHPAARKALSYSVHASLLRSADACTSCHVDAAAHADSAVDPSRPPLRPSPVAASACAACHRGPPLDPATGAHPWTSQLDRVPEPPPPQRIDSAPPELRASLEHPGGYELGAMLRFGYRFVEVFGSRERYDTDLNLDEGVRLTDLELEARGREGALFDRASVELKDLEDPYMRLRGELAKDGVGRLRGRFQKEAFKYRARGDFHRVDLRTEEHGFDFDTKIGKDTAVGLSFTRRQQEGFWLTNRIGNRNVTPASTVPGVQSPRDHDLDRYEASVRSTALGPEVRAGLDYRAHNDVDRWFFSRPAPNNPLATESEDFTSNSTLHGPGGRLEFRDHGESFAWSLAGRVVDLERRVRGNGRATGFDIDDFVTDTSAFATGDARTWLVDATATWDLTQKLALLGDLRLRDHREDMHIDQVDLTTYPDLGTSTSVGIGLDQRTEQNVIEGTVSLQYEAVEGLRLTAGYGFAREHLRVPDLEAGDQDFRRGTLRDDGVLLDANWRPNRLWVLSARWRDFGQNGMQLHELSDDEVQHVEGKIRYQPEGFWAEAFTDQRRKHNDVASTRLVAWTSGLSLGVKAGDDVDLWTSYAFTDLESRTLTNFYFDPDPNPVPTFVGFDGVTHTVSAGLSLALSRRVHLDIDGAYTSTQGSFDVQVFDWRADLAAKVCSSAEVGVMFRQVDYREDVAQSAGLDDYGSYLTFLYVRSRIGRAK